MSDDGAAAAQDPHEHGFLLHFKTLDDLARASGADAAELLDAAEVRALEGF